MPTENRFRHQRYEIAPTAEHFQLVIPEAPLEPESADFKRVLRSAGQVFDKAGVSSIYLVHGTLAGTDVSGIYRELMRVAPQLATSLGQRSKQLVDRFAQDMGNYTDGFASHLAAGLNDKLEAPIQVSRFHWSSENHHTGRAVAALQLLTKIANDPTEGRIMLWGHSHAGNVFAILTNLLGGDVADRERFLDCFGPWLARREPDLWQESSELLRSRGHIVSRPIDIVTYGTPIRYGWDSGGCDNLLHLINHHVIDDYAERVPFPPTAEQLRASEAGDYFQQIFIAGTNFPPGIWAWGQWKVERRLSALLQGDVASRQLIDSLRHGRRVAEDGLTMLVDYNRVDDEARTLTGHAVYTRLKWLPFHASRVAEAMFGAAGL